MAPWVSGQAVSQQELLPLSLRPGAGPVAVAGLPCHTVGATAGTVPETIPDRAVSTLPAHFDLDSESGSIRLAAAALDSAPQWRPVARMVA